MKCRALSLTMLAECFTVLGDHGMKASSVIHFPTHSAFGSPYARELNELTPNIKDKLPPTDSRFRPDQRLLEEGEVEEADKRKDEIEEKQRERRKAMTKRSEEHVPRFFVKTLDHAGREVWVTKGTYWKIRENPGFASTENLDLWC
ncbi:Oxysterol-binding protein-related protein 6 [Labeo rohita]|uniref:Oxysterol-binding protein-related protein 6 n=1 Tax=Labeo rohita TaxID=84645 RepID=A0ABQ8L1E3_LABRO|nr:Oxysterol-binding protein-related protein 6 [Labeo rohita]